MNRCEKTRNACNAPCHQASNKSLRAIFNLIINPAFSLLRFPTCDYYLFSQSRKNAERQSLRHFSRRNRLLLVLIFALRVLSRSKGFGNGKVCCLLHSRAPTPRQPWTSPWPILPPPAQLMLELVPFYRASKCHTRLPLCFSSPLKLPSTILANETGRN